ncbi:ATP-binding protein [Cytobacillus spongiae]|uniref:PAS domain-containing sensor histidine kinase n=1 Tax=Cytobacillus spongiae TaxID=2901381 RepID=UPI001F1A6719|nr:ATP-binding protein [Cytobacillus spongiae]UII57166.1 ATP-binding protein [Cytobacillus spongiae]
MPNGQVKLLEFTTKKHAVEGLHLSTFRNVSERHKMEEELRKSGEKFKQIFEGALEGIILWNDDYEVMNINRSALKMLDVSKEKIIGKSIASFLGETVNIDNQKLNEDGHSTDLVTIPFCNGQTRTFEYSSKFHVAHDLNITTFKEITEKLVMEEQLRKSDTLSVVGELAAGIAHEIRNPMTALKGFIQLLEDEVEQDHEMYFHVIKTELARIDSIINEFLILAKPQAVKFIQSNINQIMSETVELLKAQAVLHNVQIITSYAEKPPLLFCEPNQLKKVFINIIKNAIEVMPNGGIISIVIEQKDESMYHIAVKDQGKGISKEKIKKLGEPFYTTKEGGTGLGLMVSYRIIEEHKGTIDIQSEIDKGTTFHIYLPYRKGEKK